MIPLDGGGTTSVTATALTWLILTVHGVVPAKPTGGDAHLTLELHRQQACGQSVEVAAWRQHEGCCSRFCRISLGERVPDESTVRKLTRRIGAESMNELTRSLIEMALREKRFRPRAVRIGSTVIEADVRYPTDADLAAHGVRALAREARKLATLVKEERARRRAPLPQDGESTTTACAGASGNQSPDGRLGLRRRRHESNSSLPRSHAKSRSLVGGAEARRCGRHVH